MLDAGRGIAAILVVAHHIGNMTGSQVVGHGFLAVDYFVMLSGFVIARTYEPAFAAGRGLGWFAGVRIRRLWPMIVLGGALATVAYAIAPNPDVWPRWIVYQFLLIPALACWVTFPLNGPLWSLLWEAAANLLHGALLWRLRAGPLAMALMPLAAGTIWIAATHDTYNHGFRPGEGALAATRIGTAYVVGLLLARAERAGRLPAIDLGPWAPMLLIAIPMMAPEARLPEAPLIVAALFLAFPLAIVFGAAARPGARTAAAARRLGGLSYPLYAIHMPLLLIGQRLFAPTWWGWILLGAATIAAADACERWYDAPIRARLKRGRYVPA